MKTPKVKKRGVSVHSRAARRANSPSLNTDKSLKTIEPPTETSEYKPKILGAQNAGISKKKKGKSMTRQQRLRQQKGIELAERNMDKLETKKERSLVRNKTVKERAAAWEDLNEKAVNSIKPSKATDSVVDRDGKRSGKSLETMTAEADAHLLPDQLAGALTAFGSAPKDADHIASDKPDVHDEEQDVPGGEEIDEVL